MVVRLRWRGLWQTPLTKRAIYTLWVRSANLSGISLVPRRHFKESRAIYQSLEDGRNATRVSATLVYSYLLAFAARIMKLVGIQPEVR